MKPAVHKDQFELPLASALSHAVFPGRSLLNVGEVAQAWGVVPNHVFNLIEVGDLVAVDLRTSGVPLTKEDIKELKKHKSLRKLVRIPVSAFDDLLKKRRTDT